HRAGKNFGRRGFELIGTILATTAIAGSLTAVVSTLPIQLRGRLALAVVAGACVGLAAAGGGPGGFLDPAGLKRTLRAADAKPPTVSALRSGGATQMVGFLGQG